MTSEMAFLGLGSNLGDREGNLLRGLGLLADSVRLCAVSSTYETEPWGFADQPSFLNLVCKVETALTPDGLLDLCRNVEREVGRVPTFRDGPRVLDVDILAYGTEAIATPDLTVPHPRMAERAFVLAPLVEIGDQWVHPLLGRSAAQLLAEVGGKEGVKLWGSPLKTPWDG